MASLSCETDRYAELYAPWLKNPGALLDYADVTPDDRVLDLCGGSGAVAVAALQRGCTKVSLADKNPRCTDRRVKQYTSSAEEVWVLFDGYPEFDVVICRQALGYLNLWQTAMSVADIIPPGGRFCFNNFRKPRWFRKHYEYNEDMYSEVGWNIGRTVFHLQRKHGAGWDFTRFRWHKHEEVVAAMRQFFDVTWTIREKSIDYLCVVA